MKVNLLIVKSFILASYVLNFVVNQVKTITEGLPMLSSSPGKLSAVTSSLQAALEKWIKHGGNITLDKKKCQEIMRYKELSDLHLNFF